MNFDKIYFLGIGGIGMSALARYFMHEGKAVAGYDRVRSQLTAELEAEGAEIHDEDDIRMIPERFKDPATTIVVYTPAVPSVHSEYCWFCNNGFEVVKRSQMLGHLSQGKFVMAVAGTHGKTTTTTLTAFLNREVTGGGSAFLGGISKNFSNNLVLGDGPRLAVEADEFDRSFLRLYPDVAVVTSADADHLDIYGTHEAVKEAFSQFVRQIKRGGALIIKKGVDIVIDNDGIDIWRYSLNEPCDFYASRIEPTGDGRFEFDLKMPDRVIEGCILGVPGLVNIENAVAAAAMMWCAARAEGTELDAERMCSGLAGFSGVKRRFESYVNSKTAVYIDDYAHHPRELSAAIESVRGMYPSRHLTAVFQPHLYTRTRDLYAEFAEALSKADEVVLLPIYPAREEPIEGVSTEIIAERVTVPCRIVEREKLAAEIAEMKTDVVVTFGAGNIDACCEAVAEVIRNKAGL